MQSEPAAEIFLTCREGDFQAQLTEQATRHFEKLFHQHLPPESFSDLKLTPAPADLGWTPKRRPRK